jgi:hypothetical protein
MVVFVLRRGFNRALRGKLGRPVNEANFKSSTLVQEGLLR